jgi:hypothetical protein
LEKILKNDWELIPGYDYDHHMFLRILVLTCLNFGPVFPAYKYLQNGILKLIAIQLVKNDIILLLEIFIFSINLSRHL